MIRFTPAWLLCGVLLVPSLSWGQEAGREDSPPPVPAGVKFCPNLTYCKLKDRELQLDLAYPNVGKGPFPVVVFFHGTGSFAKGRKYNVPEMFELAQKGYVAVTVSFRHLPQDAFPGAIHDVKCAIRWLRAHAADYQIDPERIGAVGFSGGGSLALLLALAPAHKDLEGEGGHADQSSRVQAVVSYSAPTDLTQLMAHKPADWVGGMKAQFVQGSLATWLGGSPQKAPELYRKASPITYAHKGGPPIILLHGGADDVVPVAQAHLFTNKMNKLGGAIDLVTFHNAAHDIYEGNGVVARMARNGSHDFLATHLKQIKVASSK